MAAMELNAAETLLYELSKQTKVQQRLATYDRLVNIEDDEVDLYDSLSKLASAWIPSTIDDAIGPESDVRVKAVLLLGLLVDDANYVPQNSVAVLLRDITKKKVAPALKKMTAPMGKIVGTDVSYVIRFWTIMIRLLGPALHQGASVLNCMLDVIQPCFMQVDVKILAKSYGAWRALIDNFATDPNWTQKTVDKMDSTSVNRRVDLIMKVLRAAPCKSDMVAIEKFRTWWHLAASLGAKLEHYFDMVCLPLLRFCVGGQLELLSWSDEATVTKLSEPLDPNQIKSYALSSDKDKDKLATKPLPLFPAAQAATLEVIARFLGMDFDSKLGPLPSVCFSKADTVRQHTVVLVQCLRQWSLFAEKSTSKCGKHAVLLPKIWSQILSTIEKCRKSMSGDEERIVFTHFMAQFHGWMTESGHNFDLKSRCIMALASCESVSRRDYQGMWTLAGLVDVLVRKSSELDSDILNELLTKVLDALAQSSEEFQLKRTQQCLEVLCNFPDSLPFGTVATKWQSIASFIVALLRQTNEVNQGSKTDVNFSCAYQVLCFPLILVNRRQDLDLVEVKSVSGQWKTVYTEIQRCISLETMTSDSTCCDELCKKLIEMRFDLKNAGVVFLLTECLKTIVDTFEISSLKANENIGDSQFRPLGGLLTCVQLLASVTQSLAQISADATEESDDEKKTILTTLASASVGGVLSVLTRLLDRLETSGSVVASLELLAEPLAAILVASNDKTKAAVFRLHLTKLDQCMASVSEGLKSRYGGPFDSTLLGQIFPIFCAGLKHSRRQIRNEIVNLWQETFAQLSSLTYPDDLKIVLDSVMEKLGLCCPGLGNQKAGKLQSQTPSRPSLGDTMPIIDEDDYYGGLNVPVPKSTPKRAKKEEPVLTDFGHLNTSKSSTKKRKQSNADENDDEFVVVPPNKRHKKMALTEHQKEKLTQNSAMPFLDRVEDSQSQVCAEKRLPPEFTLDSQPATEPPFNDVVNETDPSMADVAEHMESVQEAGESDKDNLFDNPLLSNGRHLEESKDDASNSSVFGKSKSANFDQNKDTSIDVVFSSQPVDDKHSKKMREFLSPARPLKAKKTMGGGVKSSKSSATDAGGDESKTNGHQNGNGDWPIVQLDSSLSNDAVLPVDQGDEADISLDEEDEQDPLTDGKKHRRKTKAPVKIKLDHPKNRKKTAVKDSSVKKPKAKRTGGKPLQKDPVVVLTDLDHSAAGGDSGKQVNGQYSRVIVHDSDVDENGHLTDDTDPMILPEDQQLDTANSLSLFDSLAADDKLNESVVIEESLIVSDSTLTEDKSDDIQQFPDDDDGDNDKQLMPMPETPNRKEGSDSDEALKLNIPNEWTPGILKKTKTRRPPTPPSTGQFYRHVHFAASDDELQRSPTKSEGGGEKVGRRQKRCNTPPPSFTALFQPRTLDMVMKARAKSSSAVGDLSKDFLSATPPDSHHSLVGDAPLCSDASLTSNQSILVSDARLNRCDPFFPALLDCTLPVGDISRKLTSSSWDHGLKCLLASKKIQTVGDFARLSEVEINRLPIVLPKVANAHRVLTEFHEKLTVESVPLTVRHEDHNASIIAEDDAISAIKHESPHKMEPALEVTVDNCVLAETAIDGSEPQPNQVAPERSERPDLRSFEQSMQLTLDDLERSFDVNSCSRADVLVADEICERVLTRLLSVHSNVKQKMRAMLLTATE